MKINTSDGLGYTALDEVRPRDGGPPRIELHIVVRDQPIATVRYCNDDARLLGHELLRLADVVQAYYDDKRKEKENTVSPLPDAIPYKDRHGRLCRHCNDGQQDDGAPCSFCNGTGYDPRLPEEHGWSEAPRMSSLTCGQCDGYGVIRQHPDDSGNTCEHCKGTGQEP
jgi:hypothetical protein